MNDLSFDERRTEPTSSRSLNRRSTTFLPLDHAVPRDIDTPFDGQTRIQHRQRAVFGGVCDHLVKHQREYGDSVSVERNHRASEDDCSRVLLEKGSGLGFQQSIDCAGTLLGCLVVRERECLMRLSRPFTNEVSESPLFCPRVTSVLMRASTFFTR